MEIPERFGLYAILTDPLKGYDYMARLLTDRRVAFIQLRLKTAPLDFIRRQAEAVRAITEGSASRFIVNDHPAIAAECGADGVHLGQEDMTYSDARAIVGPDAIIGLSTHSPAQTSAACALAPDYIGIGPVFPTPTKANPDPVIGIDGMQNMAALATVPYVAIGGIDLSNLGAVLEGGARNFCMVRQLMRAEEPGRVLDEMERIYGKFCGSR